MRLAVLFFLALAVGRYVIDTCNRSGYTKRHDPEFQA
jgi:hypothetical protein